MDTKLDGQYLQKEAHMAATLAFPCLSTEANARPQIYASGLAALEQLRSPKNCGQTLPTRTADNFQSCLKVPIEATPFSYESDILCIPLSSHHESPHLC
ncbi:hypothetical protein L1049_011963 [Liquidambar formosana]|uniref:Uncharacterized protein n=1 Tax=Liquidambar formosana TaxID=63359 RepID=A0AAP0RS54_LIQFO